MSYADSKKYNRKESEKVREDIRECKDKILMLIEPNTNYMVYFRKYYPGVDTEVSKRRIRMTWNGITAHEDVLQMMKMIINKLETK